MNTTTLTAINAPSRIAFMAQERALNSGFRGAGFAALLGLSNFRYDALATGLHVWSTQQAFPAAELRFFRTTLASG